MDRVRELACGGEAEKNQSAIKAEELQKKKEKNEVLYGNLTKTVSNKRSF